MLGTCPRLTASVRLLGPAARGLAASHIAHAGLTGATVLWFVPSGASQTGKTRGSIVCPRLCCWRWCRLLFVRVAVDLRRLCMCVVCGRVWGGVGGEKGVTLQFGLVRFCCF